MPAVTQITGSLYDASTGQKRTTGRLTIRLRRIVVSESDLVSSGPVTVDIPASGNLSFGLVPSVGGITYEVEFDPTPADTRTPLALKAGYFKNEWLVPASAVPVAIETL